MKRGKIVFRSVLKAREQFRLTTYSHYLKIMTMNYTVVKSSPVDLTLRDWNSALSLC